MDIYIIIYENHTFTLLSRAPLPSQRETKSHCFYCSSFLSIEQLRSFLRSAVAYIKSGNIQFVTIEGFTLVY